MSHNKTWLNYTVSDMVVRLPLASNQYTHEYTLHDAAKAAFNSLGTGINLSDYDIVGVYMPGGTNFGWAGYATVGGGLQWLQNSSAPYIITHEFGHNYGLLHAYSWTTTDGSVTGSGTSGNYGDIFDIMGSGGDLKAAFHPQAQSKLNWLESTDWQDVTVSNTYRIYRFDDANASGNRALRIRRGGAYGDYWVSHRQNFDTNKHMENGLYFVWQIAGQTWGHLLDMTPDSAEGKNDAALLLGKTYSDTTAGIHITPVTKGGTSPNEWIDVQVNVGEFSGNNIPTLAGIAGLTTVNARAAVNFSALADDADGDTLAYYWDFGDGVISPNTGSISHQWAVGGTYTVKLTVSDMKGGTASTQTTVTVEDPLNVWTARVSNSTAHFPDIASDGNKLVAVSNAGEVVTSTDAITWTKNKLVGNNIVLSGVYYGNGLWVAVGQAYPTQATGGWVGVIYTSTDAVTWTRRYLDVTVATGLSKVTYGNGIWLAVGKLGRVLRSTDGITWVSQNIGTTKTISDIAYGNGQFVAIGSGVGPMMVLTSPDGLSWTDRSGGANIADSSWASFSSVAYVHDRFIASGFYTGIAYSTDNGITFQNKQPTAQFTPANVYANGLFFSAGVSDPQQGNETDLNLVSTDGMAWTALTTASQPNRNAAIVYKNTIITVGNNGSIYQSALLSTDTVPDAFSFTAQTDVPLASAVTSAPVQITGIDALTSWSTDNGDACISSGNTCNCDVAGFASNGSVSNGQYMCVQHTSANAYASSVSTSLTVGGVDASFGSTTIKNSQTISFATLGNKTLGAADFNISASASSGLPVSFSSQSSSVCTATGSLVHLVAAGTCTIRASQAGDATYSAAADVDRSFTVNPAPPKTLTVRKTGFGSVGSTPAGITCGADCSEAYAYATSVTLTATPDAGNGLVSWSGCASVAGNACTVGMTASRTVTATFQPLLALDVVVSGAGTGSGVITSSTGGINCGDDCNEPVVTGKTVTLYAKPATGSRFTGWSGTGASACTASTTCRVTMTEAKTLTARFDLLLTAKVVGNGSVSSADGNINCGSNCSHAYGSGANVTLTATPASGYGLYRWSGCSSVSGNICTVTSLTASKTVTATFQPLVVLSVGVTGTGSGKVISSPVGLIDCGTSCNADVVTGKVVYLYAKPATGSRFTGWSGTGASACTALTTCKVTMTEAKTISASFTSP